LEVSKSFQPLGRPEAALAPGDTILFTIRVRNRTAQPVAGLVFADPPIPHTRLRAGTVVVSQGQVTMGNRSGDTMVSVKLDPLGGGDEARFTYEAALDDPLPPGVTHLLTQGILYGPTVGGLPTDDAASPPSPDATLVPVAGDITGAAAAPSLVPAPTATASLSGALLESVKDDFLVADLDRDGRPSPGDVLGYLVGVVNLGDADAQSVTFRDSPDPNAPLFAGTVISAPGGRVLLGNRPGASRVRVRWRSIPASEDRSLCVEPGLLRGAGSSPSPHRRSRHGGARRSHLYSDECRPYGIHRRLRLGGPRR
jgi:uncharacterized repeat protein (TIGR01451 family)